MTSDVRALPVGKGKKSDLILHAIALTANVASSECSFAARDLLKVGYEAKITKRASRASATRSVAHYVRRNSCRKMQERPRLRRSLRSGSISKREEKEKKKKKKENRDDNRASWGFSGKGRERHGEIVERWFTEDEDLTGEWDEWRAGAISFSNQTFWK